MFIVVVGPIDHWWNENWETTPQHVAYMEYRDNVVVKRLVEAGHTVYCPWRAFKGRWDERYQAINDLSIDTCDAMVNLRPPGVPAYGTEEEVQRFLGVHRRVNPRPYFEAPPGDLSQIEHLIVPLEDPYGDVHRKSYVRPQEAP